MGSFNPPNPTSTVGGDDARQNQLAASQSQVVALNKDLAFRTTGARVNWNANVKNGGFSLDPKSPKYVAPPLMPYAWELDDPNPDGFVYYRQSRTMKLDDPSLGFSFPPLETVDHSKSQGQLMAEQKAGGIATAIGDEEHGEGNQGKFHAFEGSPESPSKVDTNPEGTKKTITRDGETFDVVKVAGLGAIFGGNLGGGYWQRV